MRRSNVIRLVTVTGSYIAKDTEGKRSDYQSGEVTFVIEIEKHFFRIPLQEWLRKNTGRIKWRVRHLLMKEDAQDVYNTYKVIKANVEIIDVIESKVIL